MAELITLTVPLVKPSTTTYKVVYLCLDWRGSRITLELEGNDGTTRGHIYEGPSALSMMVALNKANLVTTSLQKRIINQLVTDGVIAGVVSGTPD